MAEESSGSNRKVEVCFSPALFPVYFQDKNCVVVVIDVFRATSAICSAIDNGVKSILPVATVEEATIYKEKGFIVGAERQAEVVEGFDFGNSPITFKSGKYKGEEIVLTTTNGTKAIDLAKEAYKVVIGSFANLDAVCNYIEQEDKDVILFCAGWKDRFNLEDTLFAGAVVEKLVENLRFSNLADSALASLNLYNTAKNDLYGFLNESSHRKRLSRLNLEEDIIYCLTLNQSNNVPILKDGKIVKS
ncbi:MAG: 2-phosphosulfolactate phosphatase [Flavobacteriales bacterium]|nr:2-phosphosulfolactate phosphatase [Flavobacteriales bacterium]